MRLPGYAQSGGVRLTWGKGHSRHGMQAGEQAACPTILLQKSHWNQNLVQRQTERKTPPKNITRNKTEKREELNIL